MTDDRPADEQWVTDPRFELNELRRPQFTQLRKGGLDPTEVEAYIGRLERLAKDFAKFTRELEARLVHSKSEARDAGEAQRRAVDEAMLAAFEAKERILLQAEEQAWEIEEEARRRAAAIKDSLGVTEAPDEELVGLREQLGVLQQQVEDLEIQVVRWQKRASRLEADAQRQAGMTADVAERRREVDSTAEHANQVLAAVERRSQALMAAARAEAAQIVAGAENEADRVRDRLGVVDETGGSFDPVADLDDPHREADEIRGDAEAEAARIHEEAEKEKAQLLDEARTEAHDLLDEANQRVGAHNQQIAEKVSERLAEAEHQHQEILATAEAEADRIVVAAETAATEVVAAGEARVAELLERSRAEAERLRQDGEVSSMPVQKREGEAAALPEPADDARRRRRFARQSGQLPRDP